MKKVIILISLCFIVPSLKILAQETNKIYLSGRDKDHTVKWKFYCTAGRNSGEWTTIPVPSCWEMQGFGTLNYGGDWNHPKIKVGHEKGLYKYHFSVPASWKGKTVHIIFDGSMTDTKVKINGQPAGPAHRGAFYEFKYNISDLLNYGKDNMLEVTVSKASSNQSVNKAERRADFWIFGGIFRPVYLEAKPRRHIRRVAINAKANGTFSAHVFTRGRGSAATVSGQIETLDGTKVGKAFKTKIYQHATYQTLSTKLNNIKQWSPEFPNLYIVKFCLKDKQGNVLHKTNSRFGFRTVAFRKGEGFYINGQKIRFRGVDYHSLWPTSGRTTSKALSIKDVNLMKDMNMNAVRLSHYPHDTHFYDVADSLGLLVADELAGWHDSYDTAIGHKLVKEMATRDVNHPSIIMWNNGNEGGYNFSLDDDFAKWDPQNRPVNHPGAKFRGKVTYHYPAYNCCTGITFNGRKVFFPDELLHSLYDGGGGAALQDYWNLMRSKPLSAGGFIWEYLDQCVERTDKNDRLDCNDNGGADGIVGPYRRKEGSAYAIKEIWSPVHIKKNNISANWNKQLSVENRFFYTNLNQVHFIWKLVTYPGPFDKATRETTTSRGHVASPNVKPQSSGTLHLDLPSGWEKADALRLKATGPHGQEIYQWTLPIQKPQYWIDKVVQDTSNRGHVKQAGNKYILSSGELTVTISKKSGYIEKIQKQGTSYSLNSGPVEVGGNSSLKTIKIAGKQVKGFFSDDGYTLSYSLTGGWLKITYSYRPKGEYPYFGISFDYPEEKVKGIKWLGHGPDRVWKNRLAGMEFGLWHKEHKKNLNETSVYGYSWHLPKFNGYYADLNWAVLHTSEGSITMMSAAPGIYLGLLAPHFPPHPVNARAAYPEGDLSFLHAISPIGTKWRKPVELHNPSSEPNSFYYKGLHAKRGKPKFKYKNTLWFYFGEK